MQYFAFNNFRLTVSKKKLLHYTCFKSNKCKCTVWVTVCVVCLLFHAVTNSHHSVLYDTLKGICLPQITSYYDFRQCNAGMGFCELNSLK